MSNLSIPIISCINRYKKFLYPSLSSLIENSHFTNQIIIVSEDPDLEKVIKEDFDTDFIFKYKNKTLTNQKVPYDLFNIGFKSVTKDFTITPTGDDNYYPKNWDKCLLKHVYPTVTEIWMPIYIEINTYMTNINEGNVGYSLRTNGKITENDIKMFAEKYISNKIVKGKPWKDKEFQFCPNSVTNTKIFDKCGYFPEINDPSIAADAQFFKSLYENGVSVTKTYETYIANLKDVERIL